MAGSLAGLAPRTLSGRVLLIILAGLAIAHLTSFGFAQHERDREFERAQAQGLGERIARTVLEPAAEGEAPPPPRFEHRGGRRFGGRGFAGPPIVLRAVPQVEAPLPGEEAAPSRIENAIRGSLVARMGKDPVKRVTVRDAGEAPHGMGFERGGPGGPPPGEDGDFVLAAAHARVVAVTLELPRGGLAVAEGEVVVPPWRLPPRSWIGIAIAFALTAVFTFVAAQVAVRPVRRLAEAAERLSRNLDEPPMPETGARELANAAHAFNRMQDRLRRHVKTRSLAFAALSHDMRTPLTRMHLRLESLDHPGQLERLRADLDEIEALATSALEVTRGLHQEEPLAETSLADMARGVAQDFAASGHRIEVSGAAPPMMLRPRAVRRALCNLVENATRYGTDVSLVVFEEPGRAGIRVLDRGPGIPEAEMGRVLEPYYRVESSRSRATGGAGLGLAIARDIADAHGGELVLAPRDGGGLEARLVFPVA